MVCRWRERRCARVRREPHESPGFVLCYIVILHCVRMSLACQSRALPSQVSKASRCARAIRVYMHVHISLHARTHMYVRADALPAVRSRVWCRCIWLYPCRKICNIKISCFFKSIVSSPVSPWLIALLISCKMWRMCTCIILVHICGFLHIRRYVHAHVSSQYSIYNANCTCTCKKHMS